MNKLLLSITFFTLISFRILGQEFIDENMECLKLTGVSKDATYGFQIGNPIYVGPEDKMDIAYINALTSCSSNQIYVEKIYYNFRQNPNLVQIVIGWDNSNKTVALYISTKKYVEPKAPKGFCINRDFTIPLNLRFPQKKVNKVNPCSNFIYSIKSETLNRFQIDTLPIPDKRPFFKSDSTSLDEFFILKSVSECPANPYNVYVRFLVNCQGKIGNFKILNINYPIKEKTANEVLAIVNKMPNNWVPALKNGLPVDCYQIIHFEFKGGGSITKYEIY